MGHFIGSYESNHDEKRILFERSIPESGHHGSETMSDNYLVSAIHYFIKHAYGKQQTYN